MTKAAEEKEARRKEKLNKARKDIFDRLDQGELFDIAEAAKLVRKMTGLNQKDFAAKLDIGLAQVKNVEGGRGNPTLETLKKIIEAAGLKMKVTR